MEQDLAAILEQIWAVYELNSLKLKAQSQSTVEQMIASLPEEILSMKVKEFNERVEIADPVVSEFARRPF